MINWSRSICRWDMTSMLTINMVASQVKHWQLEGRRDISLTIPLNPVRCNRDTSHTTMEESDNLNVAVILFRYLLGESAEMQNESIAYWILEYQRTRGIQMQWHHDAESNSGHKEERPFELKWSNQRQEFELESSGITADDSKAKDTDSTCQWADINAAGQEKETMWRWRSHLRGGRWQEFQ